MKANEFAKSQSVAKTLPLAESATKETLSEAKKLKFKKPISQQKTHRAAPPSEGASDVLGPGVVAAPGSELHRIRSHNPTLWTKIQNWD